MCIEHAIMGCGDLGRRLAGKLIDQHVSPKTIFAFVNSTGSATQSLALGLKVRQIDLDSSVTGFDRLQSSKLYYLVPPQPEGNTDQRSALLIKTLQRYKIRPKKMVLVSTTGVYGDHQGQWINEQTPVMPETDRGRRRLDSEVRWSAWADQQGLPLVILRVPGIYSFSRLPRNRIAAGTPVVASEYCGYSNRIHADDLVTVMQKAMQQNVPSRLYNATDGRPGKMCDYLQAAAAVLELPVLPEISMQQACAQLSPGMLSYLNESRKISNQKLLADFHLRLKYPDFREGIKVG